MAAIPEPYAVGDESAVAPGGLVHSADWVWGASPAEQRREVEEGVAVVDLVECGAAISPSRSDAPEAPANAHASREEVVEVEVAEVQQVEVAAVAAVLGEAGAAAFVTAQWLGMAELEEEAEEVNATPSDSPSCCGPSDSDCTASG